MRDKTGREIKHGDLIKLFHFTSAIRRRKCYMYKLVMESKDGLVMASVTDIATKGIIGAHRCRLGWASSENMEIIDGFTECYWYDRPKESKNEQTRKAID